MLTERRENGQEAIRVRSPGLLAVQEDVGLNPCMLPDGEGRPGYSTPFEEDPTASTMTR